MLLILSLSGCIIAVDTDEFRDDGSSWRENAETNKREIHDLTIGRSIESVVGSMGQPDISEAFERDGKTVRVYYYRTRRVHSDSLTTKNETTPLVFADGVLVGWGDAALQQASAH